MREGWREKGREEGSKTKKEKEKRKRLIRNEEVKMPLFVDDLIIFVQIIWNL